MRSLVIFIFLYALTAELETITKAFEMRCYQKLLNIWYKVYITNMKIRRKIQAAIGRYDDPGQETESKLILTCVNVFWFSKDSSTGHNEWEKRRTGRQFIKGGKTIL